MPIVGRLEIYLNLEGLPPARVRQLPTKTQPYRLRVHSKRSCKITRSLHRNLPGIRLSRFLLIQRGDRFIEDRFECGFVGYSQIS